MFFSKLCVNNLSMTQIFSFFPRCQILSLIWAKDADSNLQQAYAVQLQDGQVPAAAAVGRLIIHQRQRQKAAFHLLSAQKPNLFVFSFFAQIYFHKRSNSKPEPLISAVQESPDSHRGDNAHQTLRTRQTGTDPSCWKVNLCYSLRSWVLRVICAIPFLS